MSEAGSLTFIIDTIEAFVDNVTYGQMIRESKDKKLLDSAVKVHKRFTSLLNDLDVMNKEKKQ